MIVKRFFWGLLNRQARMHQSPMRLLRRWPWVAVPLTPLAIYIHQRHHQIETREINEPLFIETSDPIYPLEPLKIVVRWVYLSVLYTPLLLSLPLWLLIESWTGRQSRIRMAWFELLCWTFETSGPTFIKLGQWASSRADLFPPYLCQVLSRLQSSVHPHAFKDTEAVLSREYGSRWREIFKDFDENPMGAGAIAQVCFFLNLQGRYTKLHWQTQMSK